MTDVDAASIASALENAGTGDSEGFRVAPSPKEIEKAAKVIRGLLAEINALWERVTELEDMGPGIKHLGGGEVEIRVSDLPRHKFQILLNSACGDEDD